MDEKRFSGRQLTVMVVAVCAAIMLAPVGVMAATGSGVNIVDPVTSANKAGVSGNGTLLTAARDIHTGAVAAVDGSSLRVGGTVQAVSSDTTVTLAHVVAQNVVAGSTAYSSAINVAAYRSIRVGVYCSGCTSASQFALFSAGGQGYVLGHKNLEVFSNSSATGTLEFDNPGISVFIELLNNDGTNQPFTYDIYGRR